MLWHQHRSRSDVEQRSVWFHTQTGRANFRISCRDLSRALTIEMSPHCWTYTRALQRGKSIFPLFPSPVGSVAVVTMTSTLYQRDKPVLSVHLLASNWQLPYMKQQLGENGPRNYFMTNLHARMLPDCRIKKCGRWFLLHSRFSKFFRGRTPLTKGIHQLNPQNLSSTTTAAKGKKKKKKKARKPSPIKTIYLKFIFRLYRNWRKEEDAGAGSFLHDL